jgi:ABC-2 type transport system permease protein
MNVQALSPQNQEGSGSFVWARVRAVIEKEWAEVTKNKMILWSMALLPVLLVAMVLVTDYFMLRVPADEQEDEIDELPIPGQLAHLPPFDAFIIQMNEQFMFYLFLIPMMLPVYIAAYSIIGEKQTKTLEPLLATPVSTWELLVGKSITATAPAVVLTWLSYAIMLVGLWLIASPVVFAYSARPVWMLAMLLFSPLLAFLSVLCGVIVSSRINDPRTAQQITGVLVVPIMGVSMAVLAGWVFVSLQVVLYATMVTVIADLVVLYFAVRLFQRETILTRWK